MNACVNEPGNAGCRWKDPAGNVHSPTGVIPKGSSSSGGNAPTGPSKAQLDAAKARLDAAKAQIRNAAMGLLRILSEELGLTAGFNCFVNGDMGACAETAVNVLSSAVGGLIGKVLAKYGAPWRVVKGIKLGKRLWGLAKDLFTSVKDFIKASREFKLLRRACTALNSFVAGTRVRLANGKHKPIEKIKPGDKVLAADPRTAKTRAEPVVAAFSGTSYDHLVRLTVDTDGKRGHRTGTIVATEHHLFFDQTHHTWTPAERLTSGTQLRTPTGKSLRITQVTGQAGHPLVHDLTIARLHTYYVEADATPVLVHNCGEEADDLYRGVWPDHPDYGDALNGDAVPRGWGKPGQKLTPEEHNAGVPGLSDHTSWTTSRALATQRARGGVVLRVARGDYPTVPSPDYFGEAEVLIYGPVRGAERLQ